MIEIKLKNGEILSTRDPEIAQKALSIFKSYQYDDNYEIKGKKKTIKKGDILEIVDHRAEPIYLLQYGFKTGERISINKQQCEKALLEQIKGKDGLFVANGISISGDKIIMLRLDTNAMLGYNPDYVPEREYAKESSDYEKLYRDVFEDMKDKVKFCIENKVVQYIGKDISIKQILELPEMTYLQTNTKLLK